MITGKGKNWNGKTEHLVQRNKYHHVTFLKI